MRSDAYIIIRQRTHTEGDPKTMSENVFTKFGE